MQINRIFPGLRHRNAVSHRSKSFGLIKSIIGGIADGIGCGINRTTRKILIGFPKLISKLNIRAAGINPNYFS